MHLSRKADGSDLRRIDAGTLQRTSDRVARSSPPVFGRLFRPADTRRSERNMLDRRRRKKLSVRSYNDRPRPARADVQSKKFHVCPVYSDSRIQFKS